MRPSNAVACSVIVPFHRNVAQLSHALRAIRAAMDLATTGGELIVVSDGSAEDCSALVSEVDGVLLGIPGPSGPAIARNRGAAIAGGSILVFIDADVVIARDVLRRFADGLAGSEFAAAFGAYDDLPGDPGFVSQARNLAHSFVHQRSRRDASTFWAGLGAVRAEAFAAVGGFDERFTRPSVEDIDLGYRLRKAGFQILLDHTIRGQHLKRWTIWSMLRTDICHRGIPWTQLLHQYRMLRNDLNLSYADRACVVVAYTSLGLFAAAAWRAELVWSALVCLLVLAWLDRAHYALFLRHRGVWFTVGWYPLRALHHLSNGISFVIGTCLFVIGRMGVRLPGGLPTEAWQDYRVGTGR